MGHSEEKTAKELFEEWTGRPYRGSRRARTRKGKVEGVEVQNEHEKLRVGVWAQRYEGETGEGLRQAHRETVLMKK